MISNRMIFPIAPFSSPGKSDFCYWEDFLTNEDISYILSRKEWHNGDKAKIGSQNSNGIIDSNIRRTNVSWMWHDEENNHIWEKITKAVWAANRQFFGFDLTGCYEAMQLGIYDESVEAHYDWHTDSGLETQSVPRKLSIAILLDDPSTFEGGLLQIQTDKEPKTVEQKKGRGWLFPSWLMHRVTPVTKGMRRSLVLWVGGPAFK